MQSSLPTVHEPWSLGVSLAGVMAGLCAAERGQEVIHQPVTLRWEPDFPQACQGTGAFSEGFCKLTSLPCEQTPSSTICVRRNSPALLFFSFMQTTGAAAAKFVCGTGKGKAGAEPAGMGLTQSSRLWLTAGGKKPWAR